MSGVPASAADWLNSLPGVKPTDQFIAADRRLFETLIDRVIAASPATHAGLTSESVLTALRGLRRAVEETGIHHTAPSVKQAMEHATVVLGRGY